MKYIANVYYNESIEGFGSVVTQVQNFSPKTLFGEFFCYLLLYIKTIIERKKTYLKVTQAHYASTALRDSIL